MDVLENIAVIVPIYNNEKYIERCFISLLNQTYKNCSYYIIDDGSVDNSPLISDEYASRNSKIVVIHSYNGGVSSARNIGIEMSLIFENNQYISFIDGDDWIHNRYFEVLMKVLDIGGCNISCCNLEHVEMNVENKQINLNNLLLEVDKPENLYNKGLLNLDPAYSRLFKKSIFENERFPSVNISEDSLTIFKILYKEDKIAVIQDKLYYYYFNPESIMHSNFSPSKLKEQFYAFNMQIEYFEKNNFKLSVGGVINTAYLTYLRKYSYFKNNRLYIEVLKRIKKDLKIHTIKNVCYMPFSEYRDVYMGLFPLLSYIPRTYSRILKGFNNYVI